MWSEPVQALEQEIKDLKNDQTVLIRGDISKELVKQERKEKSGK